MTQTKNPGAPLPGENFNWKRNLAAVWLAQFFAIMGFAFAMGFVAYYIQSLGVTDPNEVKIWTGIYIAAGPMMFAFANPFWGAIGDRYGRRLMLLRANFAGAVIVFLMGCVTSVEQLVFLRLLQGISTGTVAAGMALVATTTPDRRHGLALGSLHTALVVGWMAGNSLGGILADKIGYAMTIRFGGGLLLVSAGIIYYAVGEEFTAPAPESENGAPNGAPLPHFEGVLPVLGLIAFGALARGFDKAIVPLFVQVLNEGRLEGSATIMGQLTAICCIAAAFSGISCGYLMDRIKPATIAIYVCLVGGILAGMQYLAGSIAALTGIRAAMVACTGGLDPAFAVWLTRSSSKQRRGRMIGYSVTAKNIGWMIAALSSTSLATILGLRLIFVLEGTLLILLVPALLLVVKKSVQTEEAESAS